MFSHPFSHAVRQEFLHSIRRGFNASVVIKQMQTEYGEVLDHGATQCRFFCSAGFAAWQCGILYSKLQSDALQSIERHSDKLERCSGQRHVSTRVLWRLTDILRRPQRSPALDLQNAETLRLLDVQMRDMDLWDASKDRAFS